MDEGTNPSWDEQYRPVSKGNVRARSPGSLGDRLFRVSTRSAAILLLLTAIGLGAKLALSAWPTLTRFGHRFIFTETWNPVTLKFGALSSIFGTLASTIIAVLIAVPLGIAIALFLVELVSKKISGPVGTAIELLAAVPSIIFGMWGLFVFAPFMADHVQPALGRYLGFLPLFQGPPIGIGILTAGIILALMILPFITAVARDVFQMVPAVVKDASFGLGSTTWEMTRHVTIPYGYSGLLGAVFLGLGRALGETMAVTFVIGNTHRISSSLFSPGNSIASTLANEITEANHPIYLSALIELGLILFLMTLVIQIIAQLWIFRVNEKGAGPIMIPRPTRGRKMADVIIKTLASIASALGIFFLGWILWELASRGIGALDWDFFTVLPAPPGSAHGGLASPILGTLLITGLATAIGVPIGLAAGVYVAEIDRGRWFTKAIAFTTNVLMGIPSIIIGLFVYTLIVPTGHFSGFAGAVALSLIMLPIVCRTTGDMLSLVPSELKESALALGAPEWRVTFDVTFRAAKKGLLTGVLLAIARISGETAPLLFTALNSSYWPDTLSEPTSNLPVTIFNYAMSPYPDWHQSAWGASLLIMIAVLGLTIVSRTLLKDDR